MIFAILSRTNNTICNISTLNSKYCNSSTYLRMIFWCSCFHCSSFPTTFLCNSYRILFIGSLLFLRLRFFIYWWSWSFSPSSFSIPSLSINVVFVINVVVVIIWDFGRKLLSLRSFLSLSHLYWIFFFKNLNKKCSRIPIYLIIFIFTLDSHPDNSFQYQYVPTNNNCFCWKLLFAVGRRWYLAFLYIILISSINELIFFFRLI